MAESTKAIYAALAGNVAVGAAKLVAAGFTGSSGMFSEGIHSMVDSGNELLLLYGRRRSKAPADETHPFGHGQELYFWTLIVSLLIFTGGGVISIYEGLLRVLGSPEGVSSVWNYAVLGIAAVFELASFTVGYGQFRKMYPDQPFLEVLRSSKDPTVFTVILEDASDLAGLLIAFLGVFFSSHFGGSVFDGIASILIGLLLVAVALLLVRESKGLLTGESADPEMRRRIRLICESDADVRSANPPLTMYFGPESILVAIEIQFRESVRPGDLSNAVERIETVIRSEFPAVDRIFIEAASIRNAAAPTAKAPDMHRT